MEHAVCCAFLAMLQGQAQANLADPVSVIQPKFE